MAADASSGGAANREALSRALAAVAGGDEAALRDVYDRTSAKLLGVCTRILGDRAEAEDALQDIYVIIWKRAGTFDASRASPVTWLATIARNRAIDRLRARGGRRFAPLEQALEIRDPQADALAELEAAEEARKLYDCLDGLEVRQARAIRSAFLGGMSYVELADAGAVPLGTMKSWIRRGLIRLKACLGE